MVVEVQTWQGCSFGGIIVQHHHVTLVLQPVFLMSYLVHSSVKLYSPVIHREDKS